MELARRRFCSGARCAGIFRSIEINTWTPLSTVLGKSEPLGISSSPSFLRYSKRSFFTKKKDKGKEKETPKPLPDDDDPSVVQLIPTIDKATREARDKEYRTKLETILNNFHAPPKKNMWSWLLGQYLPISKRSTSADILYDMVQHQATKEEIYQGLGFKKRSFMQWYSVTLVHLWMVSVRLRGEGQNGEKVIELLFTSLMADVDTKVKEAGVTYFSLFASLTKRCQQIYYGSMLGYDESLYENSDAALADAVYRNMLDGSSSHISAAALANMVHYMRREMHALEKMDGELFLSGYLPWGSFPSAIKT